jgi:4-hydroxy-tetrahydrodipicolinate synthase
MRLSSSLAGVWAAALSPLDADGELDLDRLVIHCNRLLAAGCRGISLFGTTGEGTAFSPAERQAGLEAVLAGGIAADRLLPATAFCDVPTTVAITRHAGSLGCPAALLLPPFYMKGVSDEGLFRHYAAVIEALGSRVLPLYLYNFPDLTGLTLAPELVRRLADAFPEVVVGLKDSSGDWSLSSRYLAALPDLDIFLGDERSLQAARRHGGAGTISGMANFIPGELVHLFGHGDDDAAQARIAEAVGKMVAHSFIPAAKAVVADLTREPTWRPVRPPLVEVDAAVGRRLTGALVETGCLAPAA